MRKMMFHVIAYMVFLAFGVGCSVKEDRGDCPCRLILGISDVKIRSNDCLELQVTSENGDVICSEKLDSASLCRELSMDVPRTSLRVMAWCGGEGMASEDGLTIPLGSQCPQIYTYSSELDAKGEECRDTLRMRKNHCVMSVSFRRKDEEVVSLSLRGNVSGYDAEGIPVEGAFLASVIRDPSVTMGCHQVVVPRQNGGELILDVGDDDGKIKSFPLSECIAASGYDWTAPDLPDLMVTIDYVLTNVTLEIQGWDEEFFFDVVL